MPQSPKRVTLLDLIQAGLLSPGVELRCEPRLGESYAGELTKDGNISFDGSEFSTPSAWARSIAGGARNGWAIVYVGQEALESIRSKMNIRPLLEDDGSDEDENGEIGEFEDDIRIRLLNRILNLDPKEFEILVGEFLKAKGFSNVRLTGQPGDSGIDGVCEMPFVKLKVAVQAKRYAAGNNVGIQPVQRLLGSMANSFDRGIFITTSTFTSTAIGWIEEEQVPIALVNGNDLVGEMIEMGLGIKTIPVIKQEVDDEFFTRLIT